MLDDDDRRALVEQRLEYAQQHPHVERVQADGRLVKDEHGVRLRAARLARKLETLRLAAGETRRLLAEREIPQPK